jgi:hypothetical protein
MVERSWFTACSGASRTDLSPRSPRRPPGGSDLALHRLPENSPVEAVTLEAPSRALARVDMVTLNTPVPAKPVSRGGSCGGRLPGAAVTGSGRVLVEFQSDSASSSLPGTSGERLVSPGPCVTAGLQRIPAESLGSDVKVRAFSGLCVGVAERLPDTAPELHVLSSPRRTVPSTQARGVERTWTCEGLNGDRAPLKIDPTTADATAIHRLAASRPRRATATFATGGRFGHRRRSVGRPAPRSMTRAERAIRNGPEPGHLIEEARSERTEAGASARTASERDRSAGEDRGDPRGSPCRMAESELGRRPEDAVRAARREVSTGTN